MKLSNVFANVFAAVGTVVYLYAQLLPDNTTTTTPTTPTTPAYTPEHAAKYVQLRDEGYTVSHTPMAIDIASKKYWHWICNGGPKPTQEEMDMAIYPELTIEVELVD